MRSQLPIKHDCNNVWLIQWPFNNVASYFKRKQSPLYDSYLYSCVLQPIKHTQNTHLCVTEESKQEREEEQQKNDNNNEQKRLRINYLKRDLFINNHFSVICFRCVSYCLRRSSLHSVSHHLLLIIGTTNISAVFWFLFFSDSSQLITSKMKPTIGIFRLVNLIRAFLILRWTYLELIFFILVK